MEIFQHHAVFGSGCGSGRGLPYFFYTFHHDGEHIVHWCFSVMSAACRPVVVIMRGGWEEITGLGTLDLDYAHQIDFNTFFFKEREGGRGRERKKERERF